MSETLNDVDDAAADPQTATSSASEHEVVVFVRGAKLPRRWIVKTFTPAYFKSKLESAGFRPVKVRLLEGRAARRPTYALVHFADSQSAEAFLNGYKQAACLNEYQLVAKMHVPRKKVCPANRKHDGGASSGSTKVCKKAEPALWETIPWDHVFSFFFLKDLAAVEKANVVFRAAALNAVRAAMIWRSSNPVASVDGGATYTCFALQQLKACVNTVMFPYQINSTECLPVQQQQAIRQAIGAARGTANAASQDDVFFTKHSLPSERLWFFLVAERLIAHWAVSRVTLRAVPVTVDVDGTSYAILNRLSHLLIRLQIFDVLDLGDPTRSDIEATAEANAHWYGSQLYTWGLPFRVDWRTKYHQQRSSVLPSSPNELEAKLDVKLLPENGPNRRPVATFSFRGPGTSWLLCLRDGRCVPRVAAPAVAPAFFPMDLDEVGYEASVIPACDLSGAFESPLDVDGEFLHVDLLEDLAPQSSTELVLREQSQLTPTAAASLRQSGAPTCGRQQQRPAQYLIRIHHSGKPRGFTWGVGSFFRPDARRHLLMDPNAKWCFRVSIPGEEEPHDLVLSKDGRTLFVVIPQQRVLKLKRVVRPSRRLREMYVRKITELNDREVVTDVYRTGWSVMPAAPRKYTVLDYPKQDLNFV